jgi:para-nitrobenzyl esterase
VSGIFEEGSAVFRGVPYAAAPVDALRFRPPQPPPRWTGLRHAARFGPAALQDPGSPPFDAVFDSPKVTSEDCLTLNVRTPAPGATSLPVLVWLHAGGFVSGSGADAMYEPHAFARDGVVTVTLNYRLGALGFLYLDELFPTASGTGNLGLLDQLAALRWVQENIAGFGGDPARVTLGGVSAGAMSTASLMTSASAEGLFARAIAQSGAGANCLSAVAATRVTRRVLTLLGVRSGDWDALRATPSERILAGQRAVAVADDPDGDYGPLGLAFGPVVDGVLLTAMPEQAVAAGDSHAVELLIGWTRDEWRLFSSLDDDANADDDARHTAVVFAEPACRYARAHAAMAATWLYRFDWPTPMFAGRLGACHGLDVPFAFDALDRDFAQKIAGPTAPGSLARTMHAAWVAFISRGAPSVPELAPWPTAPALMRLDTACGLSDPA